MKSDTPLRVRELWTVFEEFFAARSAWFRRKRPTPAQCLTALETTLVVLHGYIESLTELIEIERRCTSARTLNRTRHDN